MYELQYRHTGHAAWISGGAKSGSIAELKDRANLQNTDYRIVDEAGCAVWEFGCKVSTVKHYSVIDAWGYARNEAQVYSAHETAAQALAASQNQRNRMVIKMPSTWTDSEFFVGQTIYMDRVGGTYEVIR